MGPGRAAIDLFRNNDWAGFGKIAVPFKGTKRGAWNEFSIRVNGDAVEGWLNGEKVVATEIQGLATGPVGLVYESRTGEARFKNVKIREE